MCLSSALVHDLCSVAYSKLSDFYYFFSFELLLVLEWLKSVENVTMRIGNLTKPLSVLISMGVFIRDTYP